MTVLEREAAIPDVATVDFDVARRKRRGSESYSSVDELVIPFDPERGFPREAGEKYVGFAKATGVDCVALDNSVDPAWAAANIQVDGCVQGNLASRHMVTGGQDLVDDTRRIVEAFRNGAHIFNLGHGITPDANPDNVQLMIDTVRNG